MSEIPKTTREVFAGSGSLPNLQWVERVQMLLGRISELEKSRDALLKDRDVSSARIRELIRLECEYSDIIDSGSGGANVLCRVRADIRAILANAPKDGYEGWQELKGIANMVQALNDATHASYQVVESEIRKLLAGAPKEETMDGDPPPTTTQPLRAGLERALEELRFFSCTCPLRIKALIDAEAKETPDGQ